MQGELRTPLHWLTGREKEGILMPNDINDKSGEPFITVLQSKDPGT
jgi:hypothetical protein